VKILKQALFITICFYTAASCDGFLSLKLGVDARSNGMGLASTALPGNCAAGFNNPAGLALNEGTGVIITHHRWFQGVQGYFSGFSWSKGKNSFGLHLLYTDLGTMEYRLRADPAAAGTFNAHEFAVGMSWGRQVSATLFFGLTAKFLYEKVFVYETSGAAIDGGILWRPFDDGITIGLHLRNLGRTGKLNNRRISLPASGSLGLALPVNLPGGRWLVAADGVYYKDVGWYLHSGTEYALNDNLFLRIGLQNGEGKNDITFGLGINLNKYRLDYSYMVLHSGLGDSHKISVSINL